MSESTSIAVSRHAGQLVHNKGIFVGRCTGMFEDKWEMVAVDKWETFNLFVAPHELGFRASGRGARLYESFHASARKVADIDDLMGHDGIYLEDELELTQALEEGTYQGEWFIPTREMVRMLTPLKDSDSLREIFTRGAKGNDFLWTLSMPRMFEEVSRDYPYPEKIIHGRPHVLGGYDGRHRLAVRPESDEMIRASTGIFLGESLACLPVRIEPHYKLRGSF